MVSETMKRDPTTPLFVLVLLVSLPHTFLFVASPKFNCNSISLCLLGTQQGLNDKTGRRSFFSSTRDYVSLGRSESYGPVKSIHFIC